MTIRGILGRKLGMTQVFESDGKAVPVTVIETPPNVVVQVKTKEKDGYEAVQIGCGDAKARELAAEGTHEGPRTVPLPARDAGRKHR